MFVKVSREFFPETAKGLTMRDVKITNQDGLRFLRGCENQYDLIINDSTDPFGHTEGLFTREFYGNAIGPFGRTALWCISTEARFMMRTRWHFESCTARFTRVSHKPGLSGPYPTCPAGYWLFGFASKKYHPLRDFNPERVEKKEGSRPGTIRPISTEGRSCFQNILKIY